LRRVRTIVVLSALAAPACHAVRLEANHASVATERQQRTVHSTFWGLVSPTVLAENCEGNGVAEVSAETNLFYTLGTVLTLGFWQAADVGWNCSKDRMP